MRQTLIEQVITIFKYNHVIFLYCKARLRPINCIGCDGSEGVRRHDDRHSVYLLPRVTWTDVLK